MARTWNFPRRRHLLMQALLWIVLGATVAAAALLDRHLQEALFVQMSAPIVEGPATFALPEGWKAWSRQAEGDAVVHFAADSRSGVSRTLTVIRQRLTRMMPPVEYLIRMVREPNMAHLDFGPAMMDGWPGQQLNFRIGSPSAEAQEGMPETLCSAVVLPGNEAVLLRLDKTAPFNPEDVRLYEQVLHAIKLSPRPITGGTISLPGNITIDVPAGFTVYPQPDPLEHDAMVAALTGDGGWISAEFVPLRLEQTMPSLPMLAAIAAREQIDPRDPDLVVGWFTAAVSRDTNPDQWTIEPHDLPGVLLHRIAHVVTGSGSQGLLVILTAAAPAEDEQLQQAWSALADHIHIPLSPDLHAPLAAGAAIIKAASGQQTATPEPQQAQWWLWSLGATPVGFSHDFAADGTPLRYTVRRNWNGTATRIVQEWQSNAAGAGQTRMARADTGIGDNSPFFPFFVQTTSANAQVTTIYAIQGQEVQTVMPMAANAFAMSRRLPGLLQKVGKGGAAFWTERFWGIDDELLPVPMLVLAKTPRQEGMAREVTTEVNGTGLLSKWYFRADGTLDHADFWGDMHLRPSSQREIEAAFAGDRRLTALGR